MSLHRYTYIKRWRICEDNDTAINFFSDKLQCYVAIKIFRHICYVKIFPCLLEHSWIENSLGNVVVFCCLLSRTIFNFIYGTLLRFLKKCRKFKNVTNLIMKHSPHNYAKDFIESVYLPCACRIKKLMEIIGIYISRVFGYGWNMFWGTS